MKRVLLSLFLIPVLMTGSLCRAHEIPAFSAMPSPPNWVPVQNLMNNMTIICKVQLCQGGYSVNSGDIIGAFVGTECRGIGNPMSALGGIIFLTVGSNVQSGETVTFKFYLAATDQVVDLKETIPFVSNGEIGTMASPYVFTYNCGCSLTVTPDSRSVSSAAGSATFQIAFAGCTSQTWTVSDNADWLSVTPASGTGDQTITANYNENTGCTARTATITVTATGATGSPKTVTVVQASGGTPFLSVSHTSLNVGSTAGSTTFVITNSGCGTMSWSAASTLTLSPTSGSLAAGGSQTVTVSYAANTGCSTLNATITITATGATGSPKAVSFTQTASGTPVLSVEPLARSVSSAAGSTTFAISNTGCGTLSWTVTDDADWLSVAPASGTGSMTVTATYAQNTGGIRTATITVTATGATGSPKVVTVTQAGTGPCLPDWTPVQNQLNNMTVIAKLYISDVLSTNPGDAVGAFVGTECRGIGYPNASLGGVVFLTISSNLQSGETVTFKAWKSSECSECAITETMPFVNQQEVGTMANPYLFHCGGCQPVLSVAPSSFSFPSTAGTASLNITNTGCGTLSWSVTDDADWLTVSPSSGTNTGTLSVSYTANTGCSSRTANITVTASGATGNPKTVMVVQASGGTPVLSVEPASRTVTKDAGSTTFAVSNTGCGTLSWTASSDQAWCTLSPASGTGNGTITATCTANTGSIRTATITVTATGATGSPKVVTVTQAGTGPCLPDWTPVQNQLNNMTVIAKLYISDVLSVNPNDAVGAFVGTECRGIGYPNASLGGVIFLTITSNLQSGETVTFKAWKSSDCSECAITETMPFVNQQEVGTMANPFLFHCGCLPVLAVNPTSFSFPNTSGTAFLNISNAGCGTLSWNVADDAEWLTVSPASGTNTGTLSVSYSANTGCSSRAATITITATGATGSPKTVTVVQAANSVPILTVSPASLSLGNAAGSATFVITNSGCGTMLWSATSTSGTLSPSGGSIPAAGSQTVTLNYAANTGCSALNGTITVTATGATGSPKTISFTQSGSGTPVLTVEPASRSVSCAAGSTTFTISNAGCGNLSWNATSDAPWLSVAPASGTGSMTLTATYTQNTSGAARSANITVTAPGAAGSPKVVTVTQQSCSCNPNWTPVQNQLNNMTVIAKLYFSEVLSVNPSDAVGAFVGNECRGIGYPNASLGGMIFLTITSNLQSGETVTFKAWKSSDCSECAITETMPFVNQQEVGTMANPFLFHCGCLPVLAVNPSSLNMPCNGGTGTVNISNAGCGTLSWSVTDNAEWLTVTPVSGTNTGTLSVSVTANTGCTSRSATITITAPGATGNPKTITVVQAGASLTVSPASLSFQNTAGSQVITLTTCSAWTIATSAAWITASPGSGTGSSTVSVSVSANTGSSRTGTVTVTSCNITQTISVSQSSFNCSPHFIPVSITPNAMNINILEAKVKGVDLQAGDEIGIFDGTLCVGAVKLIKPLGTLMDPDMVSAVAYGKEGSDPGFTPGHSITFKYWKCSEQRECTLIIPHYYDPGTNPPLEIPPMTFTVTESAFVQLLGNCGAPPVANAGPDKTYNERSLVTLDGSGSYDPDGDPITYLWTPPAGITLTSNTVVNPTFTAPSVSVETVLSFSLVVNDGSASSDPDQVLIKIKPVPEHFVPCWSGAGYDHMQIYVVTAKIDTENLQPGDEIGIFDGTLCVGAGLISDVLTGTTPLMIIVSRDDGGGNGFTPGDPISYRLYDFSTNKEFTNVGATYRNDLPTWITDGKFAVGGSAFVDLLAKEKTRLTIAFRTGWNIFSVNMIPDTTNMLELFRQFTIEPVRLIKIQDELGKSVENLGIFGGWVNNIGTVSQTEGYKIKVTMNCDRTIVGTPVTLPFNIPLNTGWNIIGYPRQDEVNAMTVVQMLIDNNALIKVQDELGKSIENLGIFGGWVNNIGNFKPGEGYKIKVNFSTILEMKATYSGSVKSGKVTQPDDPVTHFKPVTVGNGVDHMNIHLVNIPSGTFHPGDEVAVFDGNVCVGGLKIRSLQSAIRNLSIPVAALDDFGDPGFTEGNTFSMRLYKADSNKEYLLKYEILNGTSTFLRNESSLVNMENFRAEVVNDVLIQEEIRVHIYPNPSGGKITIHSENPEIKGFRLEVINAIGQELIDRVMGSNREEIDITGKARGVYYVKITGNSWSRTEKIILR